MITSSITTYGLATDEKVIVFVVEIVTVRVWLRLVKAMLAKAKTKTTRTTTTAPTSVFKSLSSK
jgi:hypothetical protein